MRRLPALQIVDRPPTRLVGGSQRKGANQWQNVVTQAFATPWVSFVVKRAEPRLGFSRIMLGTVTTHQHNCATRRSFAVTGAYSSVPGPSSNRQGEQPLAEPSCADTTFLPGAAPFFTYLHTDDVAARNSRTAGPIIPSMLPTWTFDRAGEQLLVQRDARDGSSCALIVTRSGVSRTIEFPELPALVRFQTDMDTFLLRTGWLLLNYAPDRRRRDRRKFPRASTDRRRWWTDGVPEEAAPSGRERRRRAAK